MSRRDGNDVRHMACIRGSKVHVYALCRCWCHNVKVECLGSNVSGPWAVHVPAGRRGLRQIGTVWHNYAQHPAETFEAHTRTTVPGSALRGPDQVIARFGSLWACVHALWLNDTAPMPAVPDVIRSAPEPEYEQVTREAEAEQALAELRRRLNPPPRPDGDIVAHRRLFESSIAPYYHPSVTPGYDLMPPREHGANNDY